VLEGVVWRLTVYSTKPVAGVPAAGTGGSLVADSRIDIVFENGRVSGSSGCNAYAGSYVLDGTALGIGPLASTRRACSPRLMTQEAEYQRILKAVETMALSGATLRLSGPDGTLEFASEGEPSVMGAWAMTGYNNGKGGIASKKIGTTVTAVFADGRVSGSAGCNTFSGLVQVAGAEITVGPLVSTQKMCVDANVMSQEQLYLKALQTATTFELRGDTLGLRDAEGATQVTFRRQAAVK
jgi:heat shock protein HslJ